MNDGELFIHDLPHSVTGKATPVPDQPLTTLACGEEGDITTLALGEEGC